MEASDVKFLMEGVTASLERTIRRMWILAILLVTMLAASNVAWIVYESQYQDVVVTQDVEQDADNGTTHFIGGDYYGKAED